MMGSETEDALKVVTLASSVRNSDEYPFIVMSLTTMKEDLNTKSYITALFIEEDMRIISEPTDINPNETKYVEHLAQMSYRIKARHKSNIRLPGFQWNAITVTFRDTEYETVSFVRKMERP